MKSCASVVIALCATTAGAVSPVAAFRAEIESNSVDRTTRCRYYRAWYSEQCTKAEHDAILERNLAAHGKWLAMQQKMPEPNASIGKTLASVGQWKEAKAPLEIAAASADKLSLRNRTDVRFDLANCLWLEGDKEGAKKLLADIASTEWKDVVEPWTAKRARFLHEMLSDPDADLDMFKLPHSVDGKPFPTPQEAKYGERKVSLARVELRLGTSGTAGTDGTSPASRISPVSPDDPIVRLLKRKLTRFGTKFEKGGTPIEIELSSNAPVDKPQGYSLDVANGKVVVKARSRLGLTWGVVSLIQCVDRGDNERPTADSLQTFKPSNFQTSPSIRSMEVRDWPKCARRGTLAHWDPGYLEFALFNKMSSITFSTSDDRYSFSPLEKMAYRITAERFREYGIETYYMIRSVAMLPILPLSSPRTQKLQHAWARFFASIGMGVSFHFDDIRFPMHPLDVKAAGTAANLDAKYLTDMYREMKRDYPGFAMEFCPPFYWGPDSDADYPEPREPYLKSLAADLDPAIDVFWTGGSVGSWNIQPDKVKWFVDLVGRKPSIFHNGNCIGQHNYIQYGADTQGFKASHCKELFGLISQFKLNTSRFAEASEAGACMDWCWNPDAHDPDVAVRRTDEQLEGPGVYEILHEATPSISYFDKYKYGQPRSELFGESQADMDKRVAAAEKAWSNVLTIARNGGMFVNDFNYFGVRLAKRLAEYRRNPPEWLSKQYEAEMENTKYAKSEVGYDPSKGDVFIPAEMLSGGIYHKGIKDYSDLPPRNCKYLIPGKGSSPKSEMELTGRFECDPFPSPRPYKMLVVAKPHTGKRFPEIEVEVNGRRLWRGVLKRDFYFTPHEVEIPVDVMDRNNTFVIRNAFPPPNTQRIPVVHYVVIRK